MKIEKIYERRKLVFHLEDGTPVAAYGQTSGGWGRVQNPISLAANVFSQGEHTGKAHEIKASSQS